MADCLRCLHRLEHCKRRSIDDTLGRERLTTLCRFELRLHWLCLARILPWCSRQITGEQEYRKTATLESFTALSAIAQQEDPGIAQWLSPDAPLQTGSAPQNRAPCIAPTENPLRAGPRTSTPAELLECSPGVRTKARAEGSLSPSSRKRAYIAKSATWGLTILS